MYLYFFHFLANITAHIFPAPNAQMKEVLSKTVKEAKDMISKKQVECGIYVTQKTVGQAVDILRGVVTIVYPMGLPPHDPIQAEFDNEEDLSGTQVSLSTGYFYEF